MAIIWQTITDEYDIPVNFEDLNVWGPDVAASMRAQFTAVGVDGDQMYYQTRSGETLGPFSLPVAPGGSDEGIAGYIETPGSATRTALTDIITNSGVGAPTNMTSLRWPLYIAHRGGLACYPEHSIEAYRAAYASGFTPEADVRALSDGTLVCIHDATTDRTMDRTGDVSSTTPAQWRAARIKPPVNGYINGTGWGTPVFFDDYLDEFGGRAVLMIELKISGDAADRAITAIIDRGLQRSVVIQSFDLATCQSVVAAGIEALYLTDSATPASIVAAGIGYVGVSTSATNAYVTSLKNAGLRVIAYTVKTKAEADTQLGRGCDGVFCNDPWDAARPAVGATAVDLSDGHIPPSSAFVRDNSLIVPNGTTQRVDVESGGLWFYQNEAEDRGGAMRLGVLGYGGPTAKIRLWAQSFPPQANANAWFFGLYLGKQSADSPVNEEANDGIFRLAMVRRDGRKHAYEKRTPTGTTTNLGSTTAPSTPYAPTTGRSVPMLFEIEFTTTTVTIRNLTLNDTDLSVSHTAWSETGLYVTLRTKAALARFWGIHVVRS